ncbi:hypothetical protein AB1N83_006234 [Pleurotus pulmonarius]
MRHEHFLQWSTRVYVKDSSFIMVHAGYPHNSFLLTAGSAPQSRSLLHANHGELYLIYPPVGIPRVAKSRKARHAPQRMLPVDCLQDNPHTIDILASFTGWP